MSSPSLLPSPPPPSSSPSSSSSSARARNVGRLPAAVRRAAVFLSLALLMDFVGFAAGIKWLNIARIGSLASNDVIKAPEMCDTFDWLIKKQRAICRKNIELMAPVTRGAIRAIDECQHQFRARRWNCSTVNTSSIFGNVLNQGTREAAFVHAISAAGVSHAVTRACSLGELSSCGCDRSIVGTSPEGYHWAGCSDNIAYGNAFSRIFVDVREKARGKKSSRALMNLHNNQAGRKAIEDNMQVHCKCHGVSGSCELKTCWRAMPTFRQVGDILKEKFDGATEVLQKRSGSRRRLVPSNPHFKHHTSADMVYLQSSPDFCEHDPVTGSLGTIGRLCDRNSKAIDGCDLMCCGRGYTTYTRVVSERCHCKFHWCCTVKCQKCQREVEESRCL